MHDQIKASALPNLPLIWSEFNASYKNEPEITDSTYMGPWMADTIRQCDGLVDEMSYWTFSDVFEEQGVVKKPFYGGYGLIAAGSIPKPAFTAFRILHQLGNERLALDSDSALGDSRHGWFVGGGGVESRLLPIRHGYRENGDNDDSRIWASARHAYISRADGDHGDPRPAYEKMGSPVYPTQAQLQKLREVRLRLARQKCRSLKRAS